MKDYFRRSQDLIDAVRSLRRSGLSVSLPHQTANGEMFFEIEGYVLTVAQILELLDKNELDRVSIRQFGAKQRTITG
jgi:hypothetical protein